MENISQFILLVLDLNILNLMWSHIILFFKWLKSLLGRREANGVATTWLTSLPSEEKELGAIDYGKYFTIHSEDLRRVINLLDVLGNSWSSFLFTTY